MSTRYLLKADPFLSLHGSGDQGTLSSNVESESIPFGRPIADYPRLTQSLSAGICQQKLIVLLEEVHDLSELIRIRHHLEELIRIGRISYVLEVEGICLAARTSLAKQDKVSFPVPIADQNYQLSPFAYGHCDQGYFRLESPLAFTRITILNVYCSLLLTELAAPRSCSELATIFSEFSASKIQAFVGLLLGSGMLVQSHERSDSLHYWDFHDLLFHSRSRGGRSPGPYGRAKVQDPSVAPGPSHPIHAHLDPIPLYRPDLDQLSQTDISLTQALESRQSQRQHGTVPISLRQLGEFLYRSSRDRAIPSHRGEGKIHRAYPSGGSRYPLEIYVAANVCQGLDLGLYHYSPQDHQLGLVCRSAQAFSPLLSQAQSAMNQADPPQVLIVIAAQFHRTMRDYHSISYSLILKEVGSLFQTMYLVATAMQLACCALGGGDSDLFSQIVQTEYVDETSVGELVLGQGI